MGKHINGTRIVRREMYYVHAQYGRTLLLDTLRRASGGCGALCSGENLRTNIHR